MSLPRAMLRRLASIGRCAVASGAIVAAAPALPPLARSAGEVDRPSTQTMTQPPQVTDATDLARSVASPPVASRVVSSPVASPPVASPPVPSSPAAKKRRVKPVPRTSPTIVPPPKTEQPATDAARDLDLSRPVLKSAFDAADQDYARSPSRGDFGTERSPRQMTIDRAFDAAQIEGCGSHPLKFDPLPVWGDFVIGGPLLVLPYLLHAMATGRCKH